MAVWGFPEKENTLLCAAALRNMPWQLWFPQRVVLGRDQPSSCASGRSAVLRRICATFLAASSENYCAAMVPAGLKL